MLPTCQSFNVSFQFPNHILSQNYTLGSLGPHGFQFPGALAM